MLQGGIPWPRPELQADRLPSLQQGQPAGFCGLVTCIIMSVCLYQAA